MSGQLTMVHHPAGAASAEHQTQLSRAAIEMAEVDLDGGQAAADSSCRVKTGTRGAHRRVPRRAALTILGGAGQGAVRRHRRVDPSSRAGFHDGSVRNSNAERARSTSTRQVRHLSGETTPDEGADASPSGIVVRRSERGWQVGDDRRPT